MITAAYSWADDVRAALVDVQKAAQQVADAAGAEAAGIPAPAPAPAPAVTAAKPAPAFPWGAVLLVGLVVVLVLRR